VLTRRKRYFLSSIVDKLGRASHEIAIDAADLARVLDISPRTVSRWFHGGVGPRRQARERILETLVVINRLSAIMRGEAARDWLFTPTPLLDYEKPADLLRTGQYRKVIGVIEALAEGVFF